MLQPLHYQCPRSAPPQPFDDTRHMLGAARHGTVAVGNAIDHSGLVPLQTTDYPPQKMEVGAKFIFIRSGG